MSSKQLVICDKDENYTARLAAFFHGKKELALQVKTYKIPQEMREESANSLTSILLINEQFIEKNTTIEWNGSILILSERKGENTTYRYPSIFKYQSCERFIKCLFDFLKEEDMKGVWRMRKSRKGIAIGIYSPIRRLGQTTFAFEKARELSKRENVLYLNLESYAGYEGIFIPEEEKNMSVLLYYAKQESAHLGMILTTLVRCKDGVDYVPPTLLSEDIRTISPKEWIWLLQELLQESIYDVLILDLGDSIQGLYEILSFCETVYMPVADDKIAASKIKQYEDNLRRTGHGDLVERMIRCDIRRTITGKDSG